ncbi:UDP-4-amino-4,6-dideoxy-N-acetyl-beta-L-altrosamine transaminase [Plasticicumulans acidivorans]|uniref:UDP-4-amino-4, 6-dideoxy-N-acetyl-beta-L-altrosamine transaminase n=1 Tax=Plasticicumulans acidivorans TaxID=886464 RepID=A0A317MXQ5_9GAMM|nr:UDP-4-amino-4,6-dideoxy-N-acetyl-beta-L-altrosamine transaminase [Plasticicumulans acidivorans]PWV63308.1 UDP-4-amino-4,6-dideoxy-N-acetyl-beta-L-altrosamine transaminase [Plasticicumulans acidivorans]
MIPYGRQQIDADDIAAVSAVLASDFLTQGPAVPRFEAAVAARCGAAHAVAASSATAALWLAYRALGLGPGDELWTSPITFVATATAAHHCGASVDFIDIDPATGNLCPQRLAEQLARAEHDGCLPQIVAPVHFAGQPCDMPALAALAARYGFRLVEDAAHAIGARWDGVPIGAGRWSDITVFSFHPVKLITTGEGGMALCNDAALAARMRALRSHGVSREPADWQAGGEGAWYYEQLDAGWNFRLTDLQAALGSSQLLKLDDFLGRRRALAARYDRLLAGLPLRRPWLDPRAESAWHLYVVQLADAPTRRHVFDALRAAGIGVNVHYIPVYRQPLWRTLGGHDGLCPRAEAFYAGALSLPLHPGLSEAEQDYVVARLGAALEEVTA